MIDQRILRYYNRELSHIREVGEEFATQFPKIAGRLGLGSFECSDPYVERLLEGFAYLAARVQLKIDAEFPRFTQSMFETLLPGYLSPTPSCTIVRLQPNLLEGALGEGPLVARGTPLRGLIGEGEQTRCIYTTAHDVRLWPLEITEAQFHTRDIGVMGIETPMQTRSAVRVRLKATADKSFADLPIEQLDLHIRDEAGIGVRLFEQLAARCIGVVVHSVARPSAWHYRLPVSCLGQRGFDKNESLLPSNPRVFEGWRLLREYFLLPERFMFLRISGLGEALTRDDREIDITFLLDQADVELEGAVSARQFSLFCTPAINLFEKRLDRIHLSDRFSEFHLVPDRTAPLDYEIYSVEKVGGYGGASGEERRFESFYAARDLPLDRANAYYATQRVSRALSEREKLGRRRSVSYPGSEVYVSLVDNDAAPYREDMDQLGVTALCTNRDLPLHLPIGIGDTDFSLDTGAPVESIRCLVPPTAPRTALAEGSFSWRLVNHLAPNYLSISDTESGEGAAALRELLGLYADSTSEARRQIEGVLSVSSEPIIERLAGGGPASFVRGLEVTVTMDETAFEGSGIFLLGSVLDRFVSRYVTLNSFTRTVLRSAQRGEIMRWPARIGLQPNL